MSRSWESLRQLQHQNEKRMHGFILCELELGKRAAILLGNEAEGWGPWVDTTGMFEMRLDAIDLHEDWLPDPHTQRPRIPQQRKPSPWS